MPKDSCNVQDRRGLWVRPGRLAGRTFTAARSRLLRAAIRCARRLSPRFLTCRAPQKQHWLRSALQAACLSATYIAATNLTGTEAATEGRRDRAGGLLQLIDCLRAAVRGGFRKPRTCRGKETRTPKKTFAVRGLRLGLRHRKETGGNQPVNGRPLACLLSPPDCTESDRFD